MRVRLDLPHADGTTTPVLLERSQDLPDGRRKWTTRSRVPIDGAFQIREVSPRTPPVAEIREGHEDPDHSGDRSPMDGMILEGIASSTSVDWHGTAMSREALEGMAAQFRQGVPYVPAHHRDEWDDVMGTTVEAEVQESQNGLPAVLMVRTRLYQNDPRTTQLVARLQDGLRIGQSIGGWFTEMDVVTNDQEEVESITIRGVELDHLAVTRRPSNPDSYIARLLTDGTQALRAATTRSTVESTIRPGNLRHVWKVVETEDAVHVVFGKAEDHWDGVHPMNPDTEGPEAGEPMEDSMEERATQEEAPQVRAALEFQDLPLAPPDTEWNWDTEAQNAVLFQGRDEDDPDWERYAMAHTWVDPEADPETRAAYKLPIATMVDGELLAVFRGVVAAMAALNGARGGVDIPEDDRRGVYDHLSRYYAKADREPPELRAVDLELRSMVEDGPVRVAGFRDLPVEEGDRAWTWTPEDREAVLGESMDLQRFQAAHLAYNQDTPEDLESYAYPFARMVDGTLQVSMVAVRRLMASLVEGSMELQEDLRASAYEHLARYFTKSGEEPPAMMATQSSPGVAVDTRTYPCSTPTMGSDAHRGAPLATHSPDAASEVNTMSEQITPQEESTTVDRLSRLESLLERTATAVAALVDAQSSATTPEAAPAQEESTTAQDEEVQALRARLQAMESTITRMAQAPIRRGRPHAASVARDLPSTGYGMVLREAATHLPEGSALVAVCRDQEARRGADLSALPSRRSLEQDLRAILHAAMIDGVISDPDTRANWS